MYFTAVVCLAVSLSVAPAQPNNENVAKTLRTELAAKKVPGGVVGVLHGTQVTCLVSAGIANESTKQPVTSDMLFRLGSTTKMFVATATLLMEHEGKVRLNVPIRTYLPDLPVKLGSVTLEQLLTHTAGLYDEAPMYGPGDDGALAREISTWTDDRLFLEPGEAFSYANPGYWLVARILEVRDRKPFADLMRDRVFAPLGMRRSTFRPETAARFPMAAPHDKGQDLIDPQPNRAAAWASGSLFSSVPELLRFAAALLNKGMLDGHRVLPAQVVQKLMRPRVRVAGFPATKYGYGLIFKKYRGESVVYHVGARLGYGSVIDLAPDKNVAVVALGNRTGSLLTNCVRAGYESQFAMGELDNGIPPVGRHITDRRLMKPYVGHFVNHVPIEVEVYNRSVIPFLNLGGILTLKKGHERIPLSIIDDSTGSNGYQRVGLARGADGRVQLLYIEWHTFKRVD